MAECSWSRAVQRPYVLVCLTERQWDVVREACYQRGTKRAADLGQKIWDQGGGTVKPLSFDVYETLDPGLVTCLGGAIGTHDRETYEHEPYPQQHDGDPDA